MRRLEINDYLKHVGKGDYRFSSITEDGGITPDWYAEGESAIMERLNQIYDKIKELVKAEDETTVLMCSTAKLFATLYEYIGNKDFHSHCCRYTNISRYEQYEESSDLCQVGRQMQKVQNYMKAIYDKHNYDHIRNNITPSKFLQ